MGSKHKIGSARGFLLGLVLPVVGVGLVAFSKKKHPKESPRQIIAEKNQAKSQGETISEPQKRHSKHHRQSEFFRQIGKSAAKEQLQKEHPQSVKRKKQRNISKDSKQQENQSKVKGMSR